MRKWNYNYVIFSSAKAPSSKVTKAPEEGWQGRQFAVWLLASKCNGIRFRSSSPYACLPTLWRKKNLIFRTILIYNVYAVKSFYESKNSISKILHFFASILIIHQPVVDLGIDIITRLQSRSVICYHLINIASVFINSKQGQHSHF